MEVTITRNFGLIRIIVFALILFSITAFNASKREGTDKKKPDETRFTPVILAQDLDEPMAFEVMKNGNVIIAERKGSVKLYDADRDTTLLLLHIPVNTKYTGADGVVKEAEEGLIGISLDPKFESNHWVYLYYAHPTEEKHVLTRWELINNQLIPSTQKIVLSVTTQREVCCHTGGGMTWDKDGNLYLTVGNNTGNALAAHTDERPGRKNWDDQAHAANTNDLRGKILRIHPEPDGSYSIPDGNLFPKGTDKTRPEIYTMGHRNAWRVSIDSRTGYIYWGEVGPDASVDSEIGPRGYDELNQARKPGNFGWPFFVGPNEAFPYFDYEKNLPLQKKDPNNYTNLSVNNTGLRQLPSLAPPFIYYPYGASEKFPLVGSGGRSATGGPIFHASDFSAGAQRAFPEYYEGKWFVTDLSRGWIMAVTLAENGDYLGMEKFAPHYHPIEPIDMKFGPEGDLYVLEYGSTWFKKSTNSQLVRIEYNAGNRKPVAVASADKLGGNVPFSVKLSAKGTRDFDRDVLRYKWVITDDKGTVTQTLTQANPVVNFTKKGVYTATLTASDPSGASSTKSLRIISGNAEPVLSFDVTGNKTFFFPGKPFQYQVHLNDKEDGSLASGKIPSGHVAVSIQYVSEGFDWAEVIQNQRSVNITAGKVIAQSIMAKGNCNSCHNKDKASIGPALVSISRKYKNTPSELERLAKKIREGGSGVWGEAVMPANPSIAVSDANTVLDYIMHLTDETSGSLPVKGTFVAAIPKGDNGRGSYILQTGYTDRGVGNIPSHTVEKMIRMRNPMVRPGDADILTGSDLVISGSGGLPTLKPKSGTILGFRNLDMTGIKSIQIHGSVTVRENNSGGEIELRLGAPTGKLIGRTTAAIFVQPKQAPVLTLVQAMQDSGGDKAAAEKAMAKVAEIAKTANTPPKMMLNIEETVSGPQQLYFVFKNTKASQAQALLTVTGLQFMEKPDR